jgi:alpha-1,4-digalacturonate transport system permease protein
MKSFEQKVFPYVVLFPIMVILGVFLFWPALNGIWISLNSWDGMNDMKFVGLNNFKDAIIDVEFREAFPRTMLWTVLSVSLDYAWALTLALLVCARGIKGTGIIRTFFYWPAMIGGIVSALIWKFMFGESFGLVNFLIKSAGHEPVLWFSNATMAWVTLLSGIFWGGGNHMIMLIAGIKAIPDTYYEAAELQGANSFHKFFYITLPLLRPMSLVILVLSTLGAVRVYAGPLVMTGGGPGRATTFMLSEIMTTAFKDFKFGLASAMSLILFAIAIGLSLLHFQLNKGRGQEDAAQ